MSDEKTSAEPLLSYVVYKKESYVNSIELYKTNFNGVYLYQLMAKDKYCFNTIKNDKYTYLTLLGTGKTIPETFRNSYHDNPDDDYDILMAEEAYYNEHEDEYSSLEKLMFNANKTYITLMKTIWDADTEETTEENF